MTTEWDDPDCLTTHTFPTHVFEKHLPWWKDFPEILQGQQSSHHVNVLSFVSGTKHMVTKINVLYASFCREKL